MKNKMRIFSLIAAVVLSSVLAFGCAGLSDGGHYYPGIVGKDDSLENDFNAIVENPYIYAAATPTSAFSVNVNTASYSLVRRQIMVERRLERNSVRIEELINYFDYDVPAPVDADLALGGNIIDCPFTDGSKLLKVTVKAREVAADNIPNNLVFLIDVSGSMAGNDRIGLVKSSLNMLLSAVKPTDKISVVTYASGVKTRLNGASGADRDKIADVIGGLYASGATSGEQGIQTAYSVAAENFIPNGNNRVILMTDGDFNVGITDNEKLTEFIKSYSSEQKIYLTGIGVGYGNYKDSRLEDITKNADGNAFYLDSEQEARKVFINGLTGMLYAVANDVKAQVDFSNGSVEKYRLIGYENRQMSAEDFEDTEKDAGEMGSGNIITAVYEIVPTKNFDAENAAKLNVNYKTVGDGTDVSLTRVIADSTDTKDDVFVGCIVEFGLLLRGSLYKGEASMSAVKARLEELGQYVSEDTYRSDFMQMVTFADRYDIALY